MCSCKKDRRVAKSQSLSLQFLLFWGISAEWAVFAVVQFILRAIFVRGTSPHPVYWSKPGGRAAKPDGQPRLRVQDLCSSVGYKTVQKNVSFLNFQKKNDQRVEYPGAAPPVCLVFDEGQKSVRYHCSSPCSIYLNFPIPASETKAKVCDG